MANVRPGAIWSSVHEGFITNLFLGGTLPQIGGNAAAIVGRGGCRQVRPTPVRKNRPVVVTSAAVKPAAARAASSSSGS